MNKNNKNRCRAGRLILLTTILAAGSTFSLFARADEDTNPSFDNQENSPFSQPAADSNDNNGPVRMARFTYTHGDVSWRSDSSLAWSIASVNLPIRQGAQVFVPNGSRAELQFDDGSILRMGDGAVISLQTMYSDSDGEYTQIKQSDGSISMKILHKVSVYQIDTPYISAKASGPTKFRIGVGAKELIEVPSGKVTIEGRQGKVTLSGGDSLSLRDEDSPYDAIPLDRRDSWDRWNDERDHDLGVGNSDANRYLPPNIAQCAPDIDRYGSWNDVPEYGHVWCPRVSSGWRPYHYGHWAMCAPFGWTWISDEPWGWAPYHYGTWVSTSFGWAWVPGPSNQCWSPAAVSFCEFGGNVTWVPLHPREVHYASAGFGFHSGNWNMFFSIGQAAVYYPNSHGSFDARPWNSHFVNHVTNITNYNTTFINQRPMNDRTPLGYDPRNRNTLVTTSFTPRNATFGGGATMAPVSSFGGHGQNQKVGREEKLIFSQGRTVGSPQAGQLPSAGPSIRVTQQAISGDRIAPVRAQAPASVFARPLYTARPPANVQRDVPQHATMQPGIVLNNSQNTSRFESDRANGSLPTSQSDRTPPAVLNGRGSSANRTDQSVPSRQPVNPVGSIQNDRAIPTYQRPTVSTVPQSNVSAARESAMRARESLGLSGRYGSGGYSPRAQSSDNQSYRQRDTAPAPSTDRPSYRQRDTAPAPSTDRPSYRQRDTAPAPSTDRPSYRQRDTAPAPSVDRPSYRQRDTAPAPSVDRPSYRQRDTAPSVDRPSYRQRDAGPSPRSEDRSSSRSSDRAAPAPRSDSSSKDSSTTKKK